MSSWDRTMGSGTMVEESRTAAGRRRPGLRLLRSNPTISTAALTVAVVIGALALLPGVMAHGVALDRPFQLPWWSLIVPFAATESFVFHLEIYHEAHSFSFSELPLIVA